jgi:hypothetical protein
MLGKARNAHTNTHLQRTLACAQEFPSIALNSLLDSPQLMELLMGARARWPGGGGGEAGDSDDDSDDENAEGNVRCRVN